MNLHDLPGPDEDARAAVAQRAMRVLRPAGALQALDDVAIWLAGWQRSAQPAVDNPAAVVFVADHGVADERVSAYPSSVTADVLKALEAGIATAPVMARAVGASFRVVDLGVGRPTGNLRVEPALDAARFDACIAAGRESVPECDLLVVGEMGIGNTTAAAAVAASLYQGDARDWTGRGTGVDDETLERKTSVVQDALARVGSVPPLEALSELGGLELVAIAGAIVEARRRSIPVLLDGFVVTAAAAALECASAGALDHCLAAHRSAEPGHGMLLDRLGKRPLLDLGLRLGEASGGLAAIPLVRLACTCVLDVATFDDLGLEPA